MRVAVLSDLHIGCPPVPGAFGHAPAAFQAYVDGLLDTHDRVVFNGDILQTDHQAWSSPTGARAAIHRALAAHPWLRARLDHPRTVLLRGNHDDETRHVLGAETLACFDGPSGRLVVTHGDHHDPVIGTAPAVSALATWASGRIRRVGLSGLAQWLEGRDIAIKGARFGGPDGPYARGARQELARHDARVVVFGHTHVPCLHPLGSGLYANPGSASLGRRAHVSVDLTTGVVEVAHAAAVLRGQLPPPATVAPETSRRHPPAAPSGLL